jgi:hypothetical protein
MDNRIHLLAEQARQYATTRHPMTKIVLACDSYIAEQKFAELIVRECMSKVSEWDMGINDLVGATDNTSKVARDMIAEIKLHFGVEE